MRKSPATNWPGLAARSEQERVAAKFALADLPLQEIVANPLISPDEDDVSRLILETHDHENFLNHQEHDRRRVSRVHSER